MMKTKKIYALLLALILVLVQIVPVGNLPFSEMVHTGKITQAESAGNPSCSYSFNQSVGTALVVTREHDTAEGSNGGTVPAPGSSKKAVFKDGISGKGLYLDGTYGLRVFPGLTGEVYTVSLWIKPEGAGMYSPILYAGKELLTEKETSLVLTKDDAISPLVLSTSPSSGYFAGNGNGMAEGRWSHICMAVSKNKVKIYVNGKLQSEGMVLENMASGNAQWYLGIDPYNTAFQGTVDNLSFYGQCLSAENVADIYGREQKLPTKQGVTGVGLDKNAVTINGYGNTAPLYADIKPQEAENQKVTWQSSNNSVATVENGVVFGWQNGQAVITAVTEDGKHQARCTVTVAGITELSGIVLSETNILLKGDESNALLTVSPNPSQAYLPPVVWKSSDENVAVVDQMGNVAAVANGKAVITAETQDGKYSATCTVTAEGLSNEVSVESVKFTESSITLTNKKKEHTLTAVITPANAANRQCTYYSEDEDVAVVDGQGKVTAVGNGITNICVLCSDGRYTDYCKIKVTGFADTKATSLKLDHGTLKIPQGGTGYLYVEASPVTSTQDLYWSSSNTEIADVVPDEFGTSAEIIVYAEAVMGSTAMITVATEDGVSAECFVTVTEYSIKELSIEKSNIYLRPGESYDVDTEIKPEKAASADLIWRSSDKKVATVNESGVIRVQKSAKAGDKAKITSTTLSNQKKASCTVTVKAKKVPIKKLTAKKNSFTLYPGDKAKFSVNYQPPTATENKITYKSQNEKIVKIDSKGNISIPAGYKGTAQVRITAKSKNGKKATGTVKVKQREVKVKSLSMSRSSLSVYGGKNTTLYVNYKPGNATQKVNWSSSNPNLVRVTGMGRSASVQVRNLSSKGNATITAKDANGATATCKVSVQPKPKTDTSGGDSVSENKPSDSKPGNDKDKLREISFGRQSYIEIGAGKQKNLRSLLSITPSDAKCTLSWKSSSNYVSVTSSGVVSVSAKSPKRLECIILVTADGSVNSQKKTSIKILVR